MEAIESIFGLLGRKLGMTQVFDKDTGQVSPATVLEVGPCSVLSIRTREKEGYQALQLGFGKKRGKKVKKPQRLYYERIGLKEFPAFVREVAFGSAELAGKMKIGSTLGVELFEGVEKVDVIGWSKGRGFAGTIKRHGFRRGPAAHGSKNVRQMGSTGCSAYPGRTVKGRKMPGHFGAHRVTVRNLKVVSLQKERNLLFVRGAVPGSSGGYVVVQKNIDFRNKWAL
ncbi:MAG: 50S ribosomal protein L3 [Planctomycetota bacterium]|nr:MAG: 50S ribosomal protein L3 [Planctomycetota bacterium]